MAQFIIYGLVDPRNGQLRYIGMSRRSLRRPREHMKPRFLKTNTYKNNWIRQLLSESLKPEIVIIQEFQEPEILGQAEIHWITYFRAMGCPLTNQCRGGEGFTGKHSPGTRTKMSASNKSRWESMTSEERLAIGGKISSAKKGRAKSEEHKLKLSLALKGTRLGLEVKNKMSVSHKAKWSSRTPDEKIAIGQKISAAKRPPEDIEVQAVELRSKGYSLRSIAATMNRSASGIKSILNRRGIQ